MSISVVNLWLLIIEILFWFKIILVNCLLNREGAKPVLGCYCQDLVEKLVRTFIDPSSQSNSNENSAQQLEVIYQLLSRFADVQKRARRLAKRTRNVYPIGTISDRNQVCMRLRVHSYFLIYFRIWLIQNRYVGPTNCLLYLHLTMSMKLCLHHWFHFCPT